MAKIKTLVKTAEETPTAVAVPGNLAARLSAPPPAIVIKDAGSGGPYVMCCEDKSGNKDDLAKLGIKPGDFYLNLEGNQVKLMPMEYHLVAVEQFYSAMNPTGDLIKVAAEEKPGLDEHLVALMLVVLGDRVVPSRSEFRKTKVGAIHPAATALGQASSPDWGDLSEAHRATLAVEYPFARFIASATTSQQTAKSSGMKYFKARATIRPTTPAEVARVGRVDQAAFEAALANFDARVVELKGRCV